MEINAKLSKDLRQVRIHKQGTSFNSMMTLADAKKAHDDGRVTKSNAVFQCLASHDFDIKATLAYYKDRREQLAAEKASPTDES